MHASGRGEVRRCERPTQGLGANVRAVQAERRRRRAQIQRSQTAEVTSYMPRILFLRKYGTAVHTCWQWKVGPYTAVSRQHERVRMRSHIWCRVIVAIRCHKAVPCDGGRRRGNASDRERERAREAEATTDESVSLSCWIPLELACRCTAAFAHRIFDTQKPPSQTARSFVLYIRPHMTTMLFFRRSFLFRRRTGNLFVACFHRATQVRRVHAGLQPRVREPQHNLQGNHHVTPLY